MSIAFRISDWHVDLMCSTSCFLDESKADKFFRVCIDWRGCEWLKCFNWLTKIQPINRYHPYCERRSQSLLPTDAYISARQVLHSYCISYAISKNKYLQFFRRYGQSLLHRFLCNNGPFHSRIAVYYDLLPQ